MTLKNVFRLICRVKSIKGSWNLDIKYKPSKLDFKFWIKWILQKKNKNNNIKEEEKKEKKKNKDKKKDKKRDKKKMNVSDNRMKKKLKSQANKEWIKITSNFLNNS